MPRPKDINARFREIEQAVDLTVISAARQDYGPCPACGAERVVFHCHLFREPGRPIVDLCKDCALSRAGGDERIWVRSEDRTRRLWATERRREKARSVKSRAPLSQSSAEGD